MQRHMISIMYMDDVNAVVVIPIVARVIGRCDDAMGGIPSASTTWKGRQNASQWRHMSAMESQTACNLTVHPSIDIVVYVSFSTWGVGRFLASHSLCLQEERSYGSTSISCQAFFIAPYSFIPDLLGSARPFGAGDFDGSAPLDPATAVFDMLIPAQAVRSQHVF